MEGPPALAHLKACEYYEQNYISRELFDRLYRFAIVRNPFKRVESHWRFRFSEKEFETFVLSILPKLLKSENWFYCTQSEYLCDASGAGLVPNIFRLEELERDFEKIKAATGLRTSMVHVNKSKAATSEARWTGEMIDFVRSTYRSDFEMLGYSATLPEQQDRR